MDALTGTRAHISWEVPERRDGFRCVLVPTVQRVSLVAYSRRWTAIRVHHRIKWNCPSDLRLYICAWALLHSGTTGSAEPVAGSAEGLHMRSIVIRFLAVLGLAGLLALPAAPALAEDPVTLTL